MNMQWTTRDKSEWGPGPWLDEPDKLSWTDEATGLPCLIVRNAGGALCGYVGVAATHPWYGVDYGGCTVGSCSADWHYECTPEGAVEVHGGLTFAAGCSHPDDPSTGICHIPEPGQPDDVWWFGFDCAHYMDLSPAWRMTPIGDETYRTVGYVQGEVERLARQLVEVA